MGDGMDFPIEGTEEKNEYNPLHSHEPAVAPVFDPEGRCLVCSMLVALQEMRQWLDGHSSWLNVYGNHERGAEIVAVLDAQEVVKRAAAIQGFSAAAEMLTLLGGLNRGR